MSRRAFAPLDALVVAGLLATNLAALWAGRGEGPARAVEIVSPGGAETRPLEAGEVRVAGPLGPSLVRIDADGVRFASSPCPLQLCVGAGTVRRPGSVVACLPNRVAVRLLGSEDAVDAVGR